MKRIIAIAALVGLTGCATHPTGLARPPELPALPPSLAAPATRLPPLSDPSLRGVNVAGADTDAAYNALGRRYNGLVAWYECVRTSLRDGKGAGSCDR